VTADSSSGRTLVGDLVAALYECAGAVRLEGEYVASGAGQSLARWEVLYIIGEGAGSLTVPGVARRLGRTRQGVQRVVDLLLAERLVETKPNPASRRSPLYDLTSEGRRILVAINTAGEEWHEMVMQDFSAAEVRRLTAMLERLTALARRGLPAPT